ncbi:MAG TPA: helix-turn-helix domain-containing protein [Phenylobacterium sp.]|uniref:helix-turn-helix domain-containing protein n=1 Tax=Phenylobacterium sp. TaxID=1871053 RepID=UPI002BBB4016|nr:helix-turn-helix domain-containing protein [Phenylobacterium sp.]HSV03709.1 helix-turn-helix domain-containing protein [Phenylobacterium sp.]
MALDTGGLSDLPLQAAEPAVGVTAAARAPDLHSGADIGEALRLIREHLGLSIEDLAERTRVRASFLAALEQMRLETLPSRPFVIGYIRAYAQTLGLDPDVAAERFKAEEPVLDEPLAAPLGMGDERDPRVGIFVAGACVLVAAIIAWNVVQRIMSETAPPTPTASATVAEKALAEVKAGPVTLGAPLPAPVESTTPPPYLTPGIEKAKKADGTPLDPAAAAAAAAGSATASADPNLPAAFTPQGALFGAPKGQPAAAILQALRPALLVIHGADGSVYFARQLTPGEAYRVPQLGGLSVDVSEPGAFQVFVGGQSKGVLPAPLTPVAKLLGIAASPAKTARAAPAGAARPAVAAPKPVRAAASPKVTQPKPSVPKPRASAPTELPPT